MTSLPSILFVCMGNICRSPTAEIIWTNKLKNSRVVEDSFPLIDSAGTISYHEGEPPDSRMQMALRQAGYQPFGTSRQILASDFKKFDLILAMDRNNLREIQNLARASGESTDHCHLFLEFAGVSGIDEVPDPYYGGEKGFKKVIQLVEDASDRMLQRLQ